MQSQHSDLIISEAFLSTLQVAASENAGKIVQLQAARLCAEVFEGGESRYKESDPDGTTNLKVEFNVVVPNSALDTILQGYIEHQRTKLYGPEMTLDALMSILEE